MAKSRILAWIMAVAVVIIGSTAAMAADQELKIGVVDISRVNKDAPRVKQYMEELAAYKQGLETKLDVRSQNMMLDDSEIKELVDLKTKQNATDKDKARIKELEDIERGRDADFRKLQETKSLTEQQKADLKKFQDLQQRSKDTGQALIKDYEGQLQSKAQELDGKAEADVREAVKKVADSRGMSLVIAKEAVLLGGVDLTDDVIAKLDRKMQ